MKNPHQYVARRAERAAQAIYDLRDCLPAGSTRLWGRFDREARTLSEWGAKWLKAGQHQQGGYEPHVGGVPPAQHPGYTPPPQKPKRKKRTP